MFIHLTEQWIAAWNDRAGPAVLGTVHPDTLLPNVIYVGQVFMDDPGTWLIADSAFDKTRRNILAGSRASLLWLTKSGPAYQLLGEIHYEESGERFDRMIEKVEELYRDGVKAAAVLRPTELFMGPQRLLPAG